MKEQLITVPDKKLYQPTQKVVSFDENLKKQSLLMRRVLSNHDGAGLAANQIGLDCRLLVVELKNPGEGEDSLAFRAFVNPEIIEFSQEKKSLDEGCLSVPQIELPIERASKIKFKAQDISGKKIKLTAKGVFARILQHEVDHLCGIVFTERFREKYFKENPALKKLKVLFVGSGDFARPILEGLILAGFNLSIITEKPKAAGRKNELKTTAVAELGKKFGKKVIEIEDISQLQNSISGFDMLICADFGQKIPGEILKRAKIAALNLHPSLLPEYRGAAPVARAILAGEKATGVTLIKMSSEFDQGPILAQIKTEILPKDNGLSLKKRLATLGLKLLLEALPLIAKGEIREIKQNESEATSAPKLKKTDGEIDWKKSPQTIERQIRALYPWPGSYTIINGQRLIIHKARLNEAKLVLDIVQQEGRKPMRWQAYLRGYRGPKPAWFSLIKTV